MEELANLKAGSQPVEEIMKEAETYRQRFAEENEKLSARVSELENLLDDVGEKESVLSAKVVFAALSIEFCLTKCKQVSQAEAEKQACEERSEKLIAELAECQANLLKLDQSCSQVTRTLRDKQEENLSLSAKSVRL